ncbi:unnamed protein product [Paramecium sonneborni]|uniref:Uncharacterized protein n=1 Tax=Paramecium sonneborni TaxID=65129 RepID=A0A8S1N3B1_9CILI|nr:unnamed protein product [Paramecium sonneborni]
MKLTIYIILQISNLQASIQYLQQIQIYLNNLQKLFQTKHKITFFNSQINVYRLFISIANILIVLKHINKVFSIQDLENQLTNLVKGIPSCQKICQTLNTY